jgi:hypothetical protein
MNSEGNKGSAADGEYNEGKWTDEEHSKFLEGLVLYGKNWNKI